MEFIQSDTSSLKGASNATCILSLASAVIDMRPGESPRGKLALLTLVLRKTAAAQPYCEFVMLRHPVVEV